MHLIDKKALGNGSKDRDASIIDGQDGNHVHPIFKRRDINKLKDHNQDEDTELRMNESDDGNGVVSFCPENKTKKWW